MQSSSLISSYLSESRPVKGQKYRISYDLRASGRLGSVIVLEDSIIKLNKITSNKIYFTVVESPRPGINTYEDDRDIFYVSTKLFKLHLELNNIEKL